MLVNGRPQNQVDISERALAYGDGVFETIRLHQGRAIFLQAHLQRLEQGCSQLGINCDFGALKQEIKSLRADSENAVLKILISRGSGGRGYRPDENMQATRIISLHPFPDLSAFDPDQGVSVFFCRQRLSQQNELAGIKHLNRLEQVLASREWPGDEWFEGLMCDQQGNVVEGTRTNLFFAESGKLYTPSLEHCGVAGVLRQYLMSAMPERVTVCDPVSPGRLLQAQELFLCNSVIGVWPVARLLWQDKTYTFEAGHFTQLAKDIFQTALHDDQVK